MRRLVLIAILLVCSINPIVENGSAEKQSNQSGLEVIAQTDYIIHLGETVRDFPELCSVTRRGTEGCSAFAKGASRGTESKKRVHPLLFRVLTLFFYLYKQYNSFLTLFRASTAEENGRKFCSPQIVAGRVLMYVLTFLVTSAWMFLQ